MSMINVLNGTVTDDQEIKYEKNKESALKVLSLHNFVPGEVFIVGYYTEGSTEDNITTDIMVAIGVETGKGPESYRIIADRRVVVVTSVLESLPDVSAIVFDQRYVARDPESEKIYYLSRTTSPDNEEEVIYEKKEILDKCVIMDASTGEIYICNPPKLINFYDVLVDPSITEITDNNGDVTIGINTGDKTYDDLHFMTSDEKLFLSSKIFDENFEASISYQKYDKNGAKTDSLDPCVVVKTVYTLEAKYSGKQVKLDSAPEGWTYNSETGLYTKEIESIVTTSSGNVVCTYTYGNYTGQKTAKSVTSTINKYFFLLNSDINVPTVDNIMQYGQANLVSSVAGTYQVQPRSGFYVWFCFPKGMEPSAITQMGLNYVAKADSYILSEVTWKKVNLGSYTLYHSINTGNGSQQEVTIS